MEEDFNYPRCPNVPWEETWFSIFNGIFILLPSLHVRAIRWTRYRMSFASGFPLDYVSEFSQLSSLYLPSKPEVKKMSVLFLCLWVWLHNSTNFSNSRVDMRSKTLLFKCHPRTCTRVLLQNLESLYVYVWTAAELSLLWVGSIQDGCGSGTVPVPEARQPTMKEREEKRTKDNFSLSFSFYIIRGLFLESQCCFSKRE